MSRAAERKSLLLVVTTLAILFAAQFAVSDYLVLTLTRIMVLAAFASGYNVLIGYTGLVSLGHALFFAIGLYAAGLSAYHLGWPIPLAFVFGIAVSVIASALLGLLMLRTNRVSFMIVTMMFAQAGFLATLYFSNYTGGDQGLPMPKSARSFSLLGTSFDMADKAVLYNLGFLVLTVSLFTVFLTVRGSSGRMLVALRENESRTEMLGFNVFAGKLKAFTISGAISGMAGAAYGLMFGYIGSTFASTQYSVEVLLFTLLGGPGTLLGPLIGTGLMTFMIDKLSDLTTAYLLAVGLLLIGLVLWFPKGILGTIRARWAPWVI
jgi:branched-chain amino acid transport system permease protein